MTSEVFWVDALKNKSFPSVKRGEKMETAGAFCREGGVLNIFFPLSTSTRPSFRPFLAIKVFISSLDLPEIKECGNLQAILEGTSCFGKRPMPEASKNRLQHPWEGQPCSMHMGARVNSVILGGSSLIQLLLKPIEALLCSPGSLACVLKQWGTVSPAMLFWLEYDWKCHHVSILI